MGQKTMKRKGGENIKEKGKGGGIISGLLTSAESMLHTINNSLNNPENQKSWNETVSGASKILSESVHNPEFRNAVADATEAAGKGVSKVAVDIAATIPGVGAVIELGQAATDASTAVNNVKSAINKGSLAINAVENKAIESVNALQTQSHNTLANVNKTIDRHANMLNVNPLNVNPLNVNPLNVKTNPMNSSLHMKGGYKMKKHTSTRRRPITNLFTHRCQQSQRSKKHVRFLV